MRNGQFSLPSGVAVDTSGNVFVADSSNNRIQKFTSTGVFIAKWGSFGTGPGQFISPEGVAVDASESVFVADTSNSRVQKFDSTGVFITQWDGGAGGFDNPRGIAVDASGNIFVADTANNRIQKFQAVPAVSGIGSAGLLLTALLVSLCVGFAMRRSRGRRL